MTVVDKVAAADKPVVAKTPATKTAAKAAVKTAPQAAGKAATKARKAVAPAKAAAKPIAKAVAKPATKVAAKAIPPKPAKLKKPKMVRDSFTFPKAEYAVLDGLKMRAAKLGSPAKKTELLRAGIKAIAAMQDTAFLAALKSVPSLKTGRPAKAN
ncbi:MAG: hypothetical protein V4627_09265 [Pseudomonadota bacterium]